MATTATSTQYSISVGDIWRGLLVAVITPVITIIMSSLEAGTLTFDWKAIGITALAAALAYLVKNFFTPAKIIVSDPTPETVKAVKAGTAEAKIVNV